MRKRERVMKIPTGHKMLENLQGLTQQRKIDQENEPGNTKGNVSAVRSKDTVLYMNPLSAKWIFILYPLLVPRLLFPFPSNLPVISDFFNLSLYFISYIEFKGITLFLVGLSFLSFLCPFTLSPFCSRSFPFLFHISYHFKFLFEIIVLIH